MQLPVVDKEGGLAPPEFGFATSNPSAVRQAARGSNLTWEAMRHVGAGFWLTDQQVMLLHTHTATSCNLTLNPKLMTTKTWLCCQAFLVSLGLHGHGPL